MVRLRNRSPEDAGIRRDEHDPRIAWCLGKRIYQGDDSQISRLFWLLASPVGRACTLLVGYRSLAFMMLDDYLAPADKLNGMGPTILEQRDQKLEETRARRQQNRAAAKAVA